MAGAEAQALRQQPRQPGALRQLPDQGPQHRDRRRQRRRSSASSRRCWASPSWPTIRASRPTRSAGQPADAGGRAARAHQGPRRRELRQRADEERRAFGRGDGSARRHGASAHQASRHGVGEGWLPERRQSGEALAHAASPRSKPKKFGADTRAVLARARLLAGRDRQAGGLGHGADRDQGNRSIRCSNPTCSRASASW